MRLLSSQIILILNQTKLFACMSQAGRTCVDKNWTRKDMLLMDFSQGLVGLSNILEQAQMCDGAGLLFC